MTFYCRLEKFRMCCALFHECTLPYSRLFSLGANFSKWWTLSFSRNFSDLEFYNPNNLIYSPFVVAAIIVW